MTERLYYTNPELLQFDASIVSSVEKDGKYLTRLDRSAFYPTSGGQQNDLGKLNGVDIIDVIEENDDVVHLSESIVGNEGVQVTGLIDEERRFWHRQIHSAQHILSQAFARLHGLTTMSVHLGDEYGNIEVDSDHVSQSQLDEVEKLANQIIRDNLPVDILFIEHTELSNYPLRKVPTRTGRIRLIKIGEVEYSACGGTHVNSTAQVQLVKIISTVKIRGRTAVNFLCGTKAVEDYCNRYKIVADVSQHLTCNISDIPSKIEKFEAELKEQSKELTKLQKELLPVKASQFAELKMLKNNIHYVVAPVSDLNQKLLGNLCGLVADDISGIAVLTTDKKIAIASSVEQVNASEIAKVLSSELGFKGGGNQKAAQLGASETVDVKTITEKVNIFLDEL
ncbi:MAG: hypothetical protein DWP97_01880 [Calditrichaeota bacterium]|nr:MAG: hypothetical protein DWP97_01880 [Calditrichota bacterium]